MFADISNGKQRYSALQETDISQYRGMLLRFLVFLVQDPDAAEELVQETFRIALSGNRDDSKGTDLGAWLRSIARKPCKEPREENAAPASPPEG